MPANISNPLNDPQRGDCVVAHFGNHIVTRKVVSSYNGQIVYQDSRKIADQTCWITTWQGWCKKHKAEAVKD